MLKKVMLIHIGIIGLISIALSGCAASKQYVVSPCGSSDYIDIPKGGIIQSVPLPTDENKNYNIITPKSGFWMSFDCHNRMEKGK